MYYQDFFGIKGKILNQFIWEKKNKIKGNLLVNILGESKLNSLEKL